MVVCDFALKVKYKIIFILSGKVIFKVTRDEELKTFDLAQLSRDNNLILNFWMFYQSH